MKLSHLDKNDQPSMVDVGPKKSTHRKAKARAYIFLPKIVLDEFDGDELHTKKGSVFQIATIAGIMGAKKTSDLIPLCHPLQLDNISLDISKQNEYIIIDCEASCTGKTGVEMEALTGASIAALTIYDMCKALSHDIIIEKIELIQKTGGKSDVDKKKS